MQAVALCGKKIFLYFPPFIFINASACINYALLIPPIVTNVQFNF